MSSVVDGKPLPEETGHIIINRGKRLGESESVKDSYWSCYELAGELYITLNDDAEYTWKTTKEDIISNYGIEL